MNVRTQIHPGRAARNFATQSYAVYKGLFYWLTVQGYIANVLVRPIVGLILFTVLARVVFAGPMAQYLALGAATSSMIFILLGGISQSFVYERTQGTILFLFSSPANRFVNYLSRPVLHYPNAILTFIFGMFGAWLIVGMDFSLVNWVGFSVAVLVTAGAITAFCQCMGVMAIVVREWSQSLDLVSSILSVLTGTIIPLTVYPPIIQEIARFLPITNGLEAMRATFTGAVFSDVAMLVVREAVNGLGFVIVGYIGFVVFERVAKRQGTLDLESF